MGALAVAAVLVVGFASGVLSGMLGIGGASLTTPGIRFAGATALESVGSTLPAILPGALAGARRYHREGLVDVRVALVAGALGSVTAVGGAALSDHVDGSLLLVITAVILLANGLNELRKVGGAPRPGPPGADGDEPPPDATETPGPAQRAREPGAEPAVAPVAADPGGPTRYSPVAAGVVGAVAGFMAGLLGVGGGVWLLPGFARIGMPPKEAVASSLASVAILSVPAIVTQAAVGHINWSYALLLVVGVVPGARVGARFTLQGSNRRLRLLMGIFFVLLALVFGGTEVARTSG